MLSELAKIDFYGDDIIAVKDERTGKVYVNIRRMCETIGVNPASQITKLQSNPVYANAFYHSDIATVKGERESLFLEKKYIPKWLGSISVPKVKLEIRDKLLRYQLEIVDALDDYFTKGIAINPRADVLDSLTKRVEQIELKLSNKTPLHQPKKNMLHEKAKSGILEAISTEGKTTEQLYAHFSRHISALVLHTALMELERENLIAALMKATGGRYATLYQRL